MNTEQERAEFEAWRIKHYNYDDLDAFEVSFAFEAFKAGRAALQSQDREDAERYRWLRLQRSITDLACVTWNIGHDWVQMDGAVLDEAIDHARRAREGG